VNENDASFSSSVVTDKKVPPCLRRSGYAQAGLKLCQYPRSPSVKINFFTRSNQSGAGVGLGNGKEEVRCEEREGARSKSSKIKKICNF